MRIIRDKEKVLYPDLSYSVCGMCFKVHNELGQFRSEKQYGDAMESLLKRNCINFIREAKLPKSFEDEKEGRNVVDFIIDDKIILELKAKSIVTKDDYYQVMRYLTSTNKQLAILVNFRRKTVQPKRIVNFYK
ncbi:MAG: GxxExxY protein [Candidatus Spechtbacteria bacterium]|nr:GxxExxY protein [Candidatus Spechtbacteria bacterium]